MNKIEFDKEYCIQTEKGEICYWKESEFKERIAAGVKKREANRWVVKKKLKKLNANSTISHADNGAPLLHGHSCREISVSHSDALYALYFSNEAVGVDIQLFKKGVSKGRSYFVNSEEEQNLDLSDLNLHLIWGAKEAFYKSLKGNVENAREELRITAIDLMETSLILTFKKKEFRLKFRVWENFVLVWT